jgi:hypothetical protein
MLREEKLSWGSNYEQFVAAISHNADDPKVKAFLGGGLKDGADASDDKFTFQDGAIDVSKLVPTQNEIDINGSLKWAIKDPKTFCNYVTSDGPFSPGGKIVIFNGHYVIDGHHRWSQVYCCNKNAKIEATNAQIEGVEPLDVLKAMQASIALQLGKVPTASVQGTNLLQVDKGVLDSYLDKNLSDQFVKGVASNSDAVSKMKSATGSVTGEADEAAPEEGSDSGDVKELIKAYIWSNVEQMRQTSQPIEGAPKRDYMPQTDDAKGDADWKIPLAKGEVDVKSPHFGSKKEEGRAPLNHPILERWQKLSGIIKG